MSAWRRPVQTAFAPMTGADVASWPPGPAAAGDPDPADSHPGGHEPAARSGGPDSAAAPSAGTAPGDATLAETVAQAQRGDQEAFRALYRDIQPRLLRYLQALVGDDAEDVASETWLHIARDLHTFQGDGDGFRGWAATVARHRALDHLRRQARRPPPVLVPAEDLVGMAAADNTETAAEDALATAAAVRFIGSLPRDQAEAVLLRAVLGLDAASAAAVLGKRPGAVRTAAYRGLRTLARHLEEAGEGRDVTSPRSFGEPRTHR
jgi:RNA polymerase sigma-70 factor, ECF subfamily